MKGRRSGSGAVAGRRPPPSPNRGAAAPLTLERRRALAAWLLFAPALLGVATVVGYPFLRTLFVSLYDAPLLGRDYLWLGLGNYLAALRNTDFLAGALHTLYFSVTSVVLELILGIAVALLLDRQFVGRRLVRALLVLPLALPTVVNAAMWRWIYNPEYGALNALLTQSHLLPGYRSWLGSTPLAMNMVVIADVWKNFPVIALLVLAALQTIPRELHEAARVDGAGEWRRFASITLPGIRPALLVALVLRTIESLKVFDIVYVMTGGGPASSTKTLSFYVYQEAFSFLRLGSAASYAVITVLLIMLFVALYLRIIRSEGVAG